MLPFNSRKKLHTWIERMDFQVIFIWFHRPWHHRAASAPRHWGYISLSQPPAPDSAESMQNSTLCLRHFRKGMDLVWKREGVFRRQQASDCKPTHVANLRLGTWQFGFQKFGIWFIDIYCLRRCCLCTGQRHWIHFCFKPDESDKPINPQTKQKQKSTKGKLDTLQTPWGEALSASSGGWTLILKSHRHPSAVSEASHFARIWNLPFYLSTNGSMCT